MWLYRQPVYYVLNHDSLSISKIKGHFLGLTEELCGSILALIWSPLTSYNWDSRSDFKLSSSHSEPVTGHIMTLWWISHALFTMYVDCIYLGA